MCCPPGPLWLPPQAQRVIADPGRHAKRRASLGALNLPTAPPSAACPNDAAEAGGRRWPRHDVDGVLRPQASAL